MVYTIDGNVNVTRRKRIIITGNLSGVQNNFQIKLAALAHEVAMQSAFGDLRFTQADMQTLIDVWAEAIVNDTSADIWIEAPTTPADGDKETYWLYFGNAGAASEWDIGATMLFGDDFPGSSYDTAKWNVKVGTQATYVVSGGMLTFFDTDAATSDYIQTAYSTDVPVIYEYRRTYDPTEIYACTIMFGSPSTDGFGVVISTADQDRAFAEDNTASSRGLGWVIDSSVHNYKVVCTGSRVEVFEDEVSKSFVTTNIPAGVLNLRLGRVAVGGAAGNDIQGAFNWVFVRKYAANPPTASIGTEEHQRRTPQFM